MINLLVVVSKYHQICLFKKYIYSNTNIGLNVPLPFFYISLTGFLTQICFFLELVSKPFTFCLLFLQHFPPRVSLEDLYNGKTTKLQLSKNVLCSTCNG